jgi:hypothetical protein
MGDSDFQALSLEIRREVLGQDLFVFDYQYFV